MDGAEKKLPCRCPGCKKQFRGTINPQEPPPMKGDRYLLFCAECRNSGAYFTERPTPAND